VVVLALLGGFAWLVLRPHEPVFEGQPLSVVLNEANRNWALAQGYSTGVYPPGSEIPRMRAERALRGLGTNALPILVKMAGTRMSLFRKIVGSMARESNMDFLHLPPQEGKHELAAWGMRLFGREARPAVAALIRLLSDRDPEVQWAAAECLAGIGPEAAEAVPALVWMLKNRSRAKQYEVMTVSWAARALGEIGPAAGAATSALEEVTNNAALAPAHAVAAVALIKIGQGSFQTFFDRLKDTSDEVKWYTTATEVGRLGTDAAPAIPFLLTAFLHTNDFIRTHAVSLVGQFHRRPDLCLGPLVSLLRSTNGGIRWQALHALGSFGQAAKSVAPEVARCLSDHESGVRNEATTALRLIDPEAHRRKAK